jgi:hypothetical protein
MSNWRVEPIGKNKVEVVAPRVRYVIEASATSFDLQAFKGDRSVETISIKHVGPKYSLEGRNGAGHSERRTIQFKGKRVMSSGFVRGKRFRVDASVCVFAPLLIAELRKTNPPQFPLVKDFRKELKKDRRLKQLIEKHVDVGMMLAQKDSVIFACIFICAECILSGGELACVLCDLCLRPDPT